MKNNIIVGAVAGIALVLAVIALYRTPTNVFQSLGVNPGNDINSPYQCINGVCSWYYSSALRPNVVNLCSFKTPNATTTVKVLGFRVLNTTGANVFEIGQSSDSTATTTRLAYLAVGTGLFGDVASTTVEMAGQPISPNTYVNFNLATGTPGTVSLKGKCNLVLTEL